MKTMQVLLMLLLVAPPAPAEPVNDPWAQVPALPTSCYKENDDFDARAYAAQEALQNEKAQQESTNEAIAEQLRNMDMSEQQQRMMNFLMENPQEAQRYMEMVQQSGQAAQVEVPEMAERQIQLDTRLNDLKAQYDAAVQEAVGPIRARQEALQASPEACTPASLIETVELNKQQNRAYDSLCPGWWKEGGAFHTWFADFKQFQIEWGAQQDQFAADQKLNYEVMGISADQYRSTYYLSGPIEYLRRAPQVFFKRDHGPLSEEAIEACHDGHG